MFSCQNATLEVYGFLLIQKMGNVITRYFTLLRLRAEKTPFRSLLS